MLSGTATWSGGGSANANTAYTHSQAAHAPSNANYFTYSHPTGNGNNHVPANGSAGQFLKYSSAGVATWAADNNSTYTLASLGFTGATNANYFTYSHPTGNGNNHIPANGSSGQFLKYSSAGVATWAADNNSTYTLASLGYTGATNANYFTCTLASLGYTGATNATYTPAYAVAAGANTIVQRHASGYIYCNYLNITPNDIATGSVTSIVAESGNDGWTRHAPKAAVLSFLNVADGATNFTCTLSSLGFHRGY